MGNRVAAGVDGAGEVASGCLVLERPVGVIAEDRQLRTSGCSGEEARVPDGDLVESPCPLVLARYPDALASDGGDVGAEEVHPVAGRERRESPSVSVIGG
jgi:hypothetical protein